MKHDDLIKAMDYIIEETEWAEKFPDTSHDRIRRVCEAIKADEPLHFENSVEREETT